MVFAAALLIWAIGWSLHYSLAGQTTPLVLSGVFSGFFPVPIRTLNLTTSAGISTERENKQWLQQQGCEKAEVRSLTSSAMMEQGPGFVNQELTAALGCQNHTGPVVPLVLLSVCYCFSLNVKLNGNDATGLWKVIPSTQCPAGGEAVCDTSVN